MKKFLFWLGLICSFPGVAANTVETHYIPMNDGVKLFTIAAYPEKGKKLPVIITRNPYASGDPETIAKRLESLRKEPLKDYILIDQDCRGTGKSDGEFIPFVNERADGLALLDWVRKQDFYNGEIYLYGGSYSVSVYASWLNTPQPDIKGAYWGVQDSDRYNIVYRNGFLRFRLYCSWYVNVYKRNGGVKRNRKAAKFDSFPLTGISKKIFGETAEGLESVMLHPDRNDPFWKTPGHGGGEYSDSHKNSGIPTFFAGSWHDIYTAGMFDMWRSLTPEHRKKCVFAVTPFNHSYLRRSKKLLPELFSPGGALPEYSPGREFKYQWFDHLRKGTPMDKFPKGEITRFVLFGGKWVSSKEVGSDSKEMKFYLSSERTLSAEPAAEGKISYDYDPKNPAVFKGGCDGAFGGVEYQDAPNSRQDIISFVTRPLEKDMTIEGECKVKLFVSSTAPDTCFYVRLSIVKNDKALGLRNEIDSICRTNPEFKENGEAVINFKLAPHHFKVAKGEALRLDVSSSCFPYYQLHSNFKGNQALQTETQVARNTIITGKSFISVPFKQ